MLAIALTVLWATLAAGQLAPVLVGRDAYLPPTVACVNDDVLNMMGDIITSDCVSRSKGCNTVNYRCRLSDSLTVGPEAGPNINFTVSASAVFRPGDADGKVKIRLNYVDPGRDLLFDPRGFVQLWRLRPGETNAYDYTGLVQWIDNTVVDTELTFTNVAAGQHLAAFWDVGGTREGNGLPELSDPFDVGMVFDTDVPLDVFLIPANTMATMLCATADSPAVVAGCCTEVGGTYDAGAGGHCANPEGFECIATACSFSKFHGAGATVVHRVVGPAGFETPILSMQDKGRVLVMEHRTDQGNLINVQLFGTTIPAEDEGALLFRHAPMMCCNKRTMVQARVLYTDDVGGTYRSFWENRQTYPRGTLVGRRIVELRRGVFDVSTFPVGSPMTIWVLNSQMYASGDRDIIDGVALNRYTQGDGSGINKEQRNLNQMGDYMRWEDYNRVEDTSPWRDDIFAPIVVDDDFLATMVPFRQYHFYANFTEHSNVLPRDYACYPSGTTWATGHNPLGGAGTMADLTFDIDQVTEFFRGCAAGPGPCPCKDGLSGANAADACLDNGNSKFLVLHLGTVSRTPAVAGLSWCGTRGLRDLAVGGDIPGGSEGYTGAEDCLSSVFMPTSPFPNGCLRSCKHWYVAPNYQYSIALGSLNDLSVGTAPQVETVVVNVDDLGATGLHVDDVGQAYETMVTINSNVLNAPWKGEFGLDTFAISSVLPLSMPIFPNNEMISQKYAMQATYARFKVIPRVDVITFQRAAFATPEDTIEVRFRVSCPYVNLGNAISQKPGYCADMWRVTNQAGDVILVDAGADAFDSSGNTGGFADGLRPVLDEAEFEVTIEYRAADTELVFQFHNPLEPERDYGAALCSYDTEVRHPLPPKQFSLLPVISRCRTAPPACEYSEPEILCAAFRGMAYVYESVIALDLPNGITRGELLVNSRYTSYYYVWDILGQLAQGFDLTTMPFASNMMVTVYDRVNALLNAVIEMAIIPPLFPNPMRRHPRCIASPNATCPATVFDDQNTTGFNQYHFCSPVSGENEVYVAQRLIINAPFTFIDNIAALFFNITTEFVDVFIQEEQSFGIDVVQDDFLVTVTNFITMTVRYGRNLLAAPCYERFIALVNVLGPFQPDPLALVKIPGCNEENSCCYQLPFIVRGNTPDSSDIIDLDNCTDTFDACKYEIVYDPPLTPVLVAPNPTPFLALCLGVAYDITFQSPQALVDARRVIATSSGQPTNISFANPWRCPVTRTITIPALGFSPMGVDILFGTCTNPGGVGEFTFRYTDPGCEGPISAANPEPLCRRDLAFALQLLTPPGQPFLPGAGFGDPYLLAGAFTFAYNVEQTFIFPDHFLPAPTSVFPDGRYRAHFWVREAGSALEYPDVEDVRDQVEVDFVSQQEDAEGIRLFRRAVRRPLCPGTSFAEPNPIEYDFVLHDSTWNGPYTIVFLTPSAATAENITVDAASFCFDQCGLDDPLETGCCDLKIRATGVLFTVDLGTGVFTNRESGLYTLLATAAASACQALHVEIVEALLPLEAQIQCYDTNCAGTRNGEVEFFVSGGTQIPILETELVVDQRGGIRRPRYYINWTTPFGPIFQQESLLQVGEGNYSAIVTDYNDCPATGAMACAVGTASPPMTLQIVNFTEPNCTNTPGEIVFEVVSDDPTSNYTLYKLGPGEGATDGGGGTIFTDTGIVPGEEYTYFVENAEGCLSPDVSFQLDAVTDFSIRILVEDRPCTDNEPSGNLRAVPSPAGTGATVAWFVNSNPAVFSTDLVLTGVPSALYTVRAQNILGCTAQASVGLVPVSDLRISTTRTGADVLNGVIQGLISGGNGPPYTLEVVPQDGINIEFQAAANSSFFRLQMVPPQWTGIIRVVDRGGCPTEKIEPGARITADIVFQPPVNDSLVDPLSEPRKSGIGVGGYLLIIITPFAAFIAWSIYVRHNAAHLIYAPPGNPVPRPTALTPLLADPAAVPVTVPQPPARPNAPANVLSF